MKRRDRRKEKKVSIIYTEEQLLQKRKEKFLVLQCQYMALSTSFWEVLTDDETKKKMIKDLGDKFMALVEEILGLDD